MSAAVIGLVSSLAPSLVDLVRRFIPDKDKQQEAEREIIAAVDAAAGKLGDAMIEDARSNNPFQYGWRPAVGWICVTGLSLEFLVFPLVNMARGFAHAGPIVSTLDASGLMGLLLALLGMGTLRTVERLKGKA